MEDNKKNQRVDTPLFQGDANAISGLNYSVDSHDASNFNNTTNSNNVSNSHNSTTNNYIQQSEGQRLADAKREYLEFCKHKIQGGLISSQTRRELDDLGIRLSLPKVEMHEIEQSVKEAFSTQYVLSSVDQLTLDLVVRKASNNATGMKELLPKMEVLAQKVEQDDVQYWYYLLLAIEDPGLCVKRYNDRKCDNYWQSYWTFIACLRNGLPTKANMILSELDKWDYSSDNIRLLQCAESLYGYFNRNGGEEDKGFANDLLGKSYNVSRLLMDFRNSLEYLTKCHKSRAVLSESSLCNFYLQMFEIKTTAESPSYSAIAGTTSNKQKLEISNDTNKATLSPTLDQSAIDNQQVSTMKNIAPSRNNSLRNPNGKIIGGILAVAVIAAIVISFTRNNSVNESNVVVEDTTVVPIEVQPNVKSEITTSHKEEPPQKPAKVEPTETGIDAYGKGNYTKANLLLKKEIEQGNATSAYYLALMYKDGKGVSKDARQAFLLMKQAAENGCKDAYYELAEMYRLGLGTEANRANAKKWYEETIMSDGKNTELATKKLNMYK